MTIKLLEDLHKNEDKTFVSVKKYPVDTTVNPAKIFDFPFLTQKETISYMKKHNRLMFVIRGLPFTKKTKLSDMLRKTYPKSIFCSAVRHINEFIPESQRGYAGKKNINATINLCHKEVEKACLNNEPTIIVQNSHIRKGEMKEVLKFAAKYDYTVVMVVTNYKFNILMENFERNDLDKGYQRTRFLQWEDVTPLLTGWFMSLDDSQHVSYLTLQILKLMFEDEILCKQFNIKEADEIGDIFKPKKILNCFAGYNNNEAVMKKYNLSKKVQALYGKVFTISLVGYLITKTYVLGIVELNKDMKSLVLEDVNSDTVQLHAEMNPILREHGKLTKFPQENLPRKKTVLRRWENGEKINIANCSFIHIAQQSFDMIDVQRIKEFYNSLKMDEGSFISQCNYSTFENLEICERQKDTWLVRAPNKILIETIFTGLYD